MTLKVKRVSNETARWRNNKSCECTGRVIIGAGGNEREWTTSRADSLGAIDFDTESRSSLLIDARTRITSDCTVAQRRLVVN